MAANGARELVAERRDASGVRRAAAPLTGDALGAANDIKVVRGVVYVMPRPRSDGTKLKFKLSEMSAAT